jgi:methylaspartate mutase epsilon subunit
MTGTFARLREDVLAMHPSGRQVSIGDGAAFHATLGNAGSFPRRTREALRDGTTLLQPRAGVATANGQLDLMRNLVEHGEADVLPITIDSYTRQCKFTMADRYWKRAEADQDTAALNGFPAVSAGVATCRRIVEACQCPVQVRHGSPDARLLAEVTLAGGCSAFEGGAITYCVPYSRDTTIEESLAYWRYVDRLCGEYARAGVLIERESFGALTGLLVPPAVAIVCGVLELLLAVPQGVRAFALGVAQGGNTVQDIAAIQALRGVAHAYMAQYLPDEDIQLSTVLYQWMGPFPRDQADALAIIALAALAAAVGGATRTITKTAEEAYGVPTAEANVAGLRFTRAMIRGAARGLHVDAAAVNEEQTWIEREARCILDHVLQGSRLARLPGRIVEAFASGCIDIPFAPNRHVRGEVWPRRDNAGAIRYGAIGRLPFDEEIIERNQELIYAREGVRGRLSRAEDVVAAISDDLMVIGDAI